MYPSEPMRDKRVSTKNFLLIKPVWACIDVLNELNDP